MSVPVSLDRLREEQRHFGANPYLLTVSAEGRPHAVAVTVSWEGDALVIEVGRRTRANARDRPLVSLLWPPSEPGGYSLIVDGAATPHGDEDDAPVAVIATTAVLHRPAPAETASTDRGSCGSDCVTLGEA